MSLRRSRQTARRWLRDGQGRLISATMSNLFAEVGGALMTPALERCRGPGVARAAGWAVYLQARVVQLCIDPLSAAGTAFPGSSVRGILPVQSCGEWNEACWVVARRLQPHGLNLGLVMEQGG
ncbi:MAG: aminotransferase class IV [Rhodanobacter sp.]